MALDFFEDVNGFEEEPEAKQSGQQEKKGQHTQDLFVLKIFFC